MTTLALERTVSVQLHERKQSRTEPAVEARTTETNAIHAHTSLHSFARRPLVAGIETSLASMDVVALDHLVLTSFQTVLTRTFGAHTGVDVLQEESEEEPGSVLDEETIERVRIEARTAAAEGTARLRSEIARFQTATARARAMVDALQSQRRGKA